MTPEQKIIDDEDVKLTHDIAESVTHDDITQLPNVTELQGFAYRVYLCRQAQKSYFHMRNSKILAHAKSLEKELDQRVSEILRNVISLDNHLIDESELPY